MVAKLISKSLTIQKGEIKWPMFQTGNRGSVKANSNQSTTFLSQTINSVLQYNIVTKTISISSTNLRRRTLYGQIISHTLNGMGERIEPI